MDDFGNEIRSLDQIRGLRSLGLYGWYDGDDLAGLISAIDGGVAS